MAASNDYNNQLVPHYGPNYNPYYNNYYQQQQQQQPPPPHPYYSYSPDDVTDNGIPSVITTDNTQPSVGSPAVNGDYPNFGRSSNEDYEDYDDEDDIPYDIVASQARAWRDAQARNQQQPNPTLLASQARAWRDAQARNQQQPSTFLTTTFQPTRPNVSKLSQPESIGRYASQQSRHENGTSDHHSCGRGRRSGSGSHCDRTYLSSRHGGGWGHFWMYGQQNTQARRTKGATQMGTIQFLNWSTQDCIVQYDYNLFRIKKDPMNTW
jgi:hypothetical protein